MAAPIWKTKRCSPTDCVAIGHQASHGSKSTLCAAQEFQINLLSTDHYHYISMLSVIIIIVLKYTCDSLPNKQIRDYSEKVRPRLPQTLPFVVGAYRPPNTAPPHLKSASGVHIYRLCEKNHIK
jgi:hypothetical protein